MIGFWLVNLLPPEVPQSFTLKTPAGHWTFRRSSAINTAQPAIRHGACAKTYAMKFHLPTDRTRSSVKEAAFKEILPICLAASFVTGAAVTVRNHPGSEITSVMLGSNFPRERGIPDPIPCVSTMNHFLCFVERFIGQYESLNGAGEKLLLLTHFYIDALSCWSLENLYLSGSTLLQIVARTEGVSGRGKATFFDNLAAAAARVGMAPPSHDVVKIRNSLIHEGTLRSKEFPTQTDASEPIAEALSWVDEYMYAILKLGSVPTRRHQAHDLAHSLNSVSF